MPMDGWDRRRAPTGRVRPPAERGHRRRRGLPRGRGQRRRLERPDRHTEMPFVGANCAATDYPRSRSVRLQKFKLAPDSQMRESERLDKSAARHATGRPFCCIGALDTVRDHDDHRRAQMAEENFNTNLMRMIAGQLHCLAGMTAAREMFGKSYFSLGVAEKIAVDNALNGIVAANFQAITPAFLAAQQAQQPVGFGIPAAAPTKEKS